MVERQFQTKLKVVQTDWGGDFEAFPNSSPLSVSFTGYHVPILVNKTVLLKDDIGTSLKLGLLS